MQPLLIFQHSRYFSRLLSISPCNQTTLLTTSYLSHLSHAFLLCLCFGSIHALEWPPHSSPHGQSLCTIMIQLKSHLPCTVSYGPLPRGSKEITYPLCVNCHTSLNVPCLTSEAKQGWAWVVFGWEITSPSPEHSQSFFMALSFSTLNYMCSAHVLFLYPYLLKVLTVQTKCLFSLYFFTVHRIPYTYLVPKTKLGKFN